MTKFDKLFFESNMVKSGTEIVKKNIGKIFVENDGTVIFPGEEYGLHTRVFITKAGYPTYEGKEMGNGFAEYEAFAFDKKMHIVGSEQTGYFQVIFKALELLAPDKFKDKQYHLPMGMVQFLDRKMSSRTGDILRVDWLIDQVKDAVLTMFTQEKIDLEKKEALLEQIAIGAIKYSILKVTPKQDVKFDIQTSVSLQGNSGSYLQYTYARTQSILRKAQNLTNSNRHSGERSESRISDLNRSWTSQDDGGNDSLLYNKAHYEIEELSLLRQMYQFSEVVERAAESYSPNILCEYLFTLAQEFNLFYQKHRIVDAADEKDRQFRVQLTHAVGQILQKGLQLLGIATPESM